MPGAERQFSGQTIGWLRAQKDEAEYQAQKANALRNDETMRAAFAALKSGITETEVAQVVRDFFRSKGATTEFASICFGGNSAYPHHATGNRKLEANEAVLIHIGDRSRGYPSDMTRVAVAGKAPEGFDKVHAVVEQAVQAALGAAKPGVAAKMVDKAVWDVITQAVYGTSFRHRTGHVLGIDIHEGPYITATSETILQEGNAFSI